MFGRRRHASLHGADRRRRRQRRAVRGAARKLGHVAHGHAVAPGAPAEDWSFDDGVVIEGDAGDTVFFTCTDSGSPPNRSPAPRATFINRYIAPTYRSRPRTGFCWRPAPAPSSPALALLATRVHVRGTRLRAERCAAPVRRRLPGLLRDGHGDAGQRRGVRGALARGELPKKERNLMLRRRPWSGRRAVRARRRGEPLMSLYCCDVAT